jgi:hypothetical protein
MIGWLEGLLRLPRTMSGFVSELPKVDVATFARSYAARKPELGTLAGLKDLAGAAGVGTKAAPQRDPRRKLAASGSPGPLGSAGKALRSEHPHN